jgi:hypothetical protein
MLVENKHEPSKFLFCRCKNGGEIWVQLLEKVYAKIMGSYDRISGGHPRDALMDFTGAPTYRFEFERSYFNKEALWT